MGNERKFFGPDGAEEGLKLLERIAEHSTDYQLLFGLSEKQLGTLAEDHVVKNNRLTPSRQLETVENGEFVPIMQAGMVDKRPRLATDRDWRTTQSFIASQLWTHPREAFQIYWTFSKRNDVKDAARYSFCTTYFPHTSREYFQERAELMAIRTVESVLAGRKEGRGCRTTVLTVSNDVFNLVAGRLKELLDEKALHQLSTEESMIERRDRAEKLCRKVIDVTPLLMFVYVGAPLLLLQQVYLAMTHLGAFKAFEEPAEEARD